jgi:transcription-repair coupling factor (superfamily II helicase)
VQTRLLDEKHQSFFEFLPSNTKIWIKDIGLTRDVIEKSFEKASASFDDIIKQTFNTNVLYEPGALFQTGSSFEKMLAQFQVVEFGHRFSPEKGRIYHFSISPQPSFHKNFDKIVENLKSNEEQGFRNVIVADSYHQLEQLRSIFDETNPGLQYEEICMSLSKGFVDKENKIACYTDHQLFDRYHRYKVKEKYSKSKALTLKELKTLSPGDYVTHIDHGIGRFAGLVKIDNHGNKQEVLRLIYRDNDLLYVSVNALHKIAKYTGKDAAPPTLNKLGSPEWENKKKRVKRKVKDIAKDLISLYARRKAAPEFQFTEDSYLQVELESSFIYEDTPDQARATEDVKKDMQAAHPMDRLVCGDVGFGKTEVAIRAAFKAVTDGKQVAVLVPTTILALQHYHTFSERLEKFPVDIEYLNRFKSAKAVKSILERVKAGKVDILIGTHRIVNKDVVFKDLGLLIIDEEQKFGVSVKEKLKKMRVNVDVLTLTATPIPRTLHFSLMGARDLSIIATPPPNRQPVTTEIHVFNKEIIRDAIRYEMRRGGQVFFVHNRVNDIEQIGNTIHKLVPDARIGIAHGQMEGRKLEKVMMRFIEGTYDVLLSTNIIESGLDIPNANTIIINQAHMFGLSDLHQMRGRVGRSNKKAFCYLLAPPAIHLTAEARKRLRTLEEFTELGDGLKVAMRDLDIRGAGNMLGAEQSGFINDLGFETYHKILDEAVQELKEEEFKELFKGDTAFKPELLVKDCTIETDFEVLIPEDYVSNISERLQLYNELDNIESEDELNKYLETVRDRFGPLPGPVLDLVKLVRLRWMAKKLGFENLTIRNGVLKGQFLSADNDKFFSSDAFGDILGYVQAHPERCRMKELRERLLLIIEGIDHADAAIKTFNSILNFHTLQMQ